jgi:outer membrane protease
MKFGGQIRAALVCGALGAAAFPLSAQAFPLSITTSTSTLLGWAKEFVYDNGYTESELDWPLLPAFSAGLTLSVGETEGFLASVDLQVGIPTRTGTMTDSDFLNGDGVKTHFSASDGVLESALLLNVQAGWAFSFMVFGSGKGFLEPFLGFEYLRMEWTAQNGYLQYPPETSYPYTPWSPSTPQTPVYGTGIIYTQNYVIPTGGVKLSLPIVKAFTVVISFTFSPYLWCWDKDSHLLRQLDFYSSMHGGILLEPRLEAAYKITDRASLTLDVLYRHISSLIGDTFEVGTGAVGYSTIGQLAPGAQSITFINAAGASFDVVTISLGLRLGL